MMLDENENQPEAEITGNENQPEVQITDNLED